MDSLEIMPIRIRIAAILRKAIYSGEYRGGDELSLTDTAQRLGVSRTPVREAFQLLEAEGLITLRMNRGAVVSTIDAAFIRDVFDMRILLESEAAFRAARSGMDAGPLLERVRALGLRLDSASPEEYEALNIAIHRGIWEAAGNQQLTRFLMNLWNGPSTGRGEDARLEHYRASTEEHIRILEAICGGKAEEARDAMAGHIRRSMNNILPLFSA